MLVFTNIHHCRFGVQKCPIVHYLLLLIPNPKSAINFVKLAKPTRCSACAGFPRYSNFWKWYKLFQLTSLTCALALAGCGGGDGDTVDSVAPAPDLGVTQPGTGGNGNTGGGEQEPGNTADFTLQQITVNPTNIELSDKLDEPTIFTVTVKAIQTASFDAMSGQEVSLRVEPSKNSGALTIEGQGTLVTDAKGDAVYQMKLNPQAVTDEAALLKNGFTVTASATKANGTVIEQVRSVPVFNK